MKTTAHSRAATSLRSHTYVYTLASQHRKALVAYAERLLADRHLAEDIVQEALIRAWNHGDKLRSGGGSVRGWLLKVTRNLAIDRTRSSYVRHETVTEDPGDGDTWQPDHADVTLAAMEAHALLRTLSAEHRAVLTHVYLSGHTLRETAQLLDIPVGTVKSRHHYALHALRDRGTAFEWERER
ncbi:sigma-70 family RNA polymerase sigma factor [Streptomyces sp. NPDC057694]|uniref:sigma-70 family RNA polymerase sigma factor n=1 Tax=Streptomyces sp. NPDC057694 TaxID=3346216 RepID=UPI003682BF0A